MIKESDSASVLTKRSVTGKPRVVCTHAISFQDSRNFVGRVCTCIFQLKQILGIFQITSN